MTVRAKLSTVLAGTADRWLLVRLCAAAAPGRSSVLLGGAVVNGLLPTVTLLAVAVAVAQIPLIPSDGGLSSAPGRRLVLAVTVALASAVLTQVIGGVQRIYAETTARRVASVLRRRAMAAVERAARNGVLDDPDLADAVREVASVEERRPLDPAIVGVTDALSARLGALGPLVVVAVFRWWLALMLAVAWLATRAVLGAENRRRMSVIFGQNERLRRANYFRELGTSLEAAKEIRIFGLAEWVTGRFREHWSRTMAELWSERATARVPLTLALLAVGGTNVLAYLLLVRRAGAGELSLGVFVAVAQAIAASAGIAGLVGVPGVDRALVPVRATRTLEERGAAGDRSAGSRSAGAFGSIRLDGVRFRYRAGDRDAVGPIDLTIPAGSVVAFVGANGAGKTTLAKLIMGLHRPVAGRVLVDEVDLAEYDQDSWWAGLGVLFQTYGRYPATLADNIACGRADPGVELDRLAAQLGLTELVDRLPQGWDTVLSPAAEGGVDLSGGQWQRVALARSLYAVRTGARLVVLDEPTANMDVLAEVDFFDRFLELRRGVTTILISHRFPAVRGADLIVVLEQGRVVEQGTHEELVERNGRYRSMFDLQAAAYRA